MGEKNNKRSEIKTLINSLSLAIEFMSQSVERSKEDESLSKTHKWHLINDNSKLLTIIYFKSNSTYKIEYTDANDCGFTLNLPMTVISLNHKENVIDFLNKFKDMISKNIMDECFLLEDELTKRHYKLANELIKSGIVHHDLSTISSGIAIYCDSLFYNRSVAVGVSSTNGKALYLTNSLRKRMLSKGELLRLDFEPSTGDYTIRRFTIWTPMIEMNAMERLKYISQAPKSYKYFLSHRPAN